MVAYADGGGPVKAMCLAVGGPAHGKYVSAGQQCESWKSGHFGAVDDPPNYGEETRALYAEEEAKAGLNLKGFRGKWKQAMQLARENERTDDNHLLPYWERVRLLFLELGGQYIDQDVRDREQVRAKLYKETQDPQG
jgi:hypothetical protein